MQDPGLEVQDRPKMMSIQYTEEDDGAYSAPPAEGEQPKEGGEKHKGSDGSAQPTPAGQTDADEAIEAAVLDD